MEEIRSFDWVRDVPPSINEPFVGLRFSVAMDMYQYCYEVTKLNADDFTVKWMTRNKYGWSDGRPEEVESIVMYDVFYHWRDDGQLKPC